MWRIVAASVGLCGTHTKLPTSNWNAKCVFHLSFFRVFFNLKKDRVKLVRPMEKLTPSEANYEIIFKKHAKLGRV